MDINGPSDWIHCPDPEKQARIRKDIEERRAYLWPEKVKRRGMPFQDTMRVRPSLNSAFPIVRWQSPPNSLPD